MHSALIRRFPHSLGWRISAWYAAGFILSFLLIGLLAAWIIEDSGLRADREEIREEFQQASNRCREVGSNTFLLETEHEPAATKATLVRLADTHGRTLLLIPPFGESASEVRRMESQFQRIRSFGWQRVSGSAGQAFWQVYTEALPDGWWLQVARSDRHGDETQGRLRAAVLPVAAAVLLAALVGAAGLTRQALRPIHRLIETSRQVVRSGDMTARVPARADGGNELDELNGLFNLMLARNENLIRGMREALDNVAHDLRTPLTRLRSSAEAALRDRSAVADKRSEALSDAIEESERALAVLRVLMDISEAERGAMFLQLEAVSMSELVAVAADLYEYVAEEKGVKVSVKVPGELKVRGDRTRLQQVIANLLDNAIKYSEPGGKVNIEARLRDGVSGEIWLRVRDQGVGITAYDLPRIWDRLYRGDRSRSQRGSGLGLSLVQAIVHAHGGQVEVTSEPNIGSTFTIFLLNAEDGNLPPQ